ncbi:MAG: winged helix DNA-binding protein [Gemmatimonadetes bacterium]|nr:winged helix DNA-binding protein [Gemmatimonadota bacterium]
MGASARRVAGEVLEVIPLVTRRVAADLRNSERSMKLAYVGLLGTVARKPRSLGELSEFHAVSLPTMSKTITTIEGLGWVVRTRSEADRRVVMVEATASGRAALKEVYDAAIGSISEVLDSLTAKQHKKLSEGLTILRDTFADSPPEREPARSRSSAGRNG